ncbi:hypothetical protein GGS20DRAFT_6825 [Poronia punctata]|nr:hypothetical protein GGS20DRAFT_6825 [Poronia punctata]
MDSGKPQAGSSNPNNLSLYFGSLTLQSSGVSPLCAMLLAMINRSLMSVQKARNAVINPQVLRIAEIVVFVGLILSSIGGSNSGSEYAKTGVYEIASLTRVGLGLTIAGFALLVVTTIAVGLHISQAEPGEKRLVLAIALSLPFLLVRIIYAAIGIFGRNPDFGVVTGDVNILLGMAVVEEIIIMFIVESIGLTLRVAPKDATESKSRGGLISMVISTFKSRFHGYEMTSMDGHSGRSRV